MKTTVVIADALLAEVQAIAAKRKTTLKSLVDEGLRHVVDKAKTEAKPVKMRDCSYPPKHMVKQKVKPMAWEEISAIIYEGRGG